MMNDVLFNSPGLRLLAAPLRDQRRGQKAWRSVGWWLDMEEWCRDQGQLGVLLMSDVRLLHLSTCGSASLLHC